MLITLVTQGIPFQKVITSLLFYNINLDTEKYKICIICNSKIKQLIDNYIVDLKFDIIYEVLDFENSLDFFKKLYAIQRKLIIEYGKILIPDSKALLINKIDICDSLLEQKIVATIDNDRINKKMFYISDLDTIDRFISAYNEYAEKTDNSNNQEITIEMFLIERELIKKIYEENNYEYFEQNHIMSSLYQFTKEGQDKKYINWNKMTFKDEPIQFYDIEVLCDPFHNKLLSQVIQQIVKLNEKYYYIFMLTRSDKKSDISIPIRNLEYGLWKNSNNSFDFILKDFAIKNNSKFTYNFLKRLSNTEFITNNVIYDRRDCLLLDKYTLTYDTMFLVNTNETVLEFLDEINKKYLFIGYVPYCKPLLDEYIGDIEGNVSYEKIERITDLSNIVYDDVDIQKCINNNGIMDTPDVDTKEELSEERSKHKELYYNHLDIINKSKYIRLNVDDKRFINTLVECMALKTIPILDKEPQLVGLKENDNYLITSDNIELDSEHILVNNEKYYNESVDINHGSKIINYLSS